MGNLFGALSGGVGGFMQGLTHGLDQVQKQKNLAAQEEQLKEQTKVLKAQQVLHDQQLQATSRLAQALMSGQPQTIPAGTTLGADTGPTPEPITTAPGTPPNLQSLLPDLLLSGKMPPEALTTMIGLNRNVTHVDMGDKIAIFQNGQLSGYLPKGALPIPEYMKPFMPGAGEAPSALATPTGQSPPTSPSAISTNYGQPRVTITPTGPRLTFAPPTPHAPPQPANVYAAGMQLGFPADMSKWTQGQWKGANEAAAKSPALPQAATPEGVFEEWSRPGGQLAGVRKDALTSQQMTDINAESSKRTLSLTQGKAAAQATGGALGKATPEALAAATKYAEAVRKGQAQTLPPEQVDTLVEAYLTPGSPMYGKIPNMGFGAAGMPARLQFLSAVSDKMKEPGYAPMDVSVRSTVYKGLQTELNNSQALRGKITNFMATNDKNLALAEKISDAVQRSDIPLLNDLLIPAKIRVGGASDVAGLNAAVRVAINETAKVLTSATGTGIMSDESRKEMEKTLNSSMNPQQVRTVIGVLRQDMKNREQSFREVESGIAARLGNLKPGSPPVPPGGIVPGVGEGGAGISVPTPSGMATVRPRK